MVKYVLVGGSLKVFSCCAAMRRLYRFLGNTYGKKKRLSNEVPGYYFDRIKQFLDLQRKFKMIEDGDKIIEIGTGWLHWDATIIRLFFDVEAILFDICDNRQLSVLKSYFSVLDAKIDYDFDLNLSQRARAHMIIEQITSAESFDSLYRQLGFQYALDRRGDLSRFPSQSFDLVISAGVLEHIKRDNNNFVHDFYRLLKPYGYSIHSINISDHLYAYDTTVSRKQYLRFSDTIWKLFFQNEVQYINRIQASEWLEIFDKARFKLLDEEREYEQIGTLKLNPQFRHLDKRDIECTSLRIVHQRNSVL